MEPVSFVPKVVDPLALSGAVGDAYHNRSLGAVNDHDLRISVMTEPYPWHFHPDSDETFLVVDGELLIEFEGESVRLRPGQLVTVPKGGRHRTRPVGERSVNLTFEKSGATTSFA